MRRRRGSGRRVEKQVCGVAEDLEERLDKAGEDVVDDEVELVRADFGAPAREDGVCSFEQREVGVVRGEVGREGGDELLWVGRLVNSSLVIV